MKIEGNSEVGDTEKQGRNRSSVYMAIALAAGVLFIYLFAMTIDWPSMWQSMENQRSAEKR